MQKLPTALALALAAAGYLPSREPLSSGHAPAPVHPAHADDEHGALPAGTLRPVFVENRGQLAQGVVATALGRGMRVDLLADGLRLSLDEGGAELGMRFVGASLSARARGVDPRAGVVNWIFGPDPARWITSLPTYGGYRYEGLYPGVDLSVHECGGRIEYDLVLAPGSALDTVGVRTSGAQGLEIAADGALLVRTPLGDVRHGAPTVWQWRGDGEREELAGRFRLLDATTFGFEVDGWTAGSTLVIDPVLSYSTYVGGSLADEARAVVADASGAVYVAGASKSSNFPMTPDAIASTRSGGKDCVVFKLDPQGNELVYATYLGGSADEEAHALAPDGSGGVVVVGETLSGDFPTTPGAFATSKARNAEAFVVHIDRTGRGLLYSTFLGGSGEDVAHGVAVDPSGAAYVTGSTRSRDFPLSSHAVQTRLAGARDAFVTKLDTGGGAVLFSTLLGGARDDEAFGIAVDRDGRPHVTGRTLSADFPTTTGALGGTRADVDAFVTKLQRDGGGLAFSTFLGGKHQEEGRSIAVGVDGDVFVTGWTSSQDFPTNGRAALTRSPGKRDAFVARLATSGAALVYSTYVGGSDADEGLGIAVDPFGYAWVTGSTQSSDLPTTPDALASGPLGGTDGFVLTLDPAGRARFATYLGSFGDDVLQSVFVDPYLGGVAVAGVSGGTPGSERGPLAGQRSRDKDAWVARLRPGRCGVPATVTSRGAGCGAALEGTPPRLGDTLVLRVSGATPAAAGTFFFSAPPAQALRLASGCEVWLDVTALLAPLAFETDAQGAYELAVPVPDDRALCGLTLATQAAVIARGTGPLAFGQLTQGLILAVGD